MIRKEGSLYRAETVGELKEVLELFPDDMPVFVIRVQERKRLLSHAYEHGYAPYEDHVIDVDYAKERGLTLI